MRPESIPALLSEPPSLRSWRQEVRGFVLAHLPQNLGRKIALGLKLEKCDYVNWQRILYHRGWFAGAWPAEHGGRGWSLLEQLVFNQESALCNAPMVIPYGVSMVGPVIYTYGNKEQQRRHLPGILASEVWWCQGYSEPGAGSDLASLKTAAVREGDHYVVSGTKMWTTEAHWADWMHCLVRTNPAEKPQRGISFLLIDMKTPGITVTPIVTIDGIHHTNQVFLDNVRVPVDNRIGEDGRGWEIAKFLLANERASIANTGPKLRFLRHLHELYEARVSCSTTTVEQQVLWRARLADVEIDLLTLCALERRYVQSWGVGEHNPAEASILKIRGTEILQAMTELALDLEGTLAAAHDPADLHRQPTDHLTDAQKASLLAHEYLYGRCWSIFGGTNEIQRNIIARQTLGT
jgi:alkylation response protein AidB-like acyl-CoA dehydrogenase